MSFCSPCQSRYNSECSSVTADCHSCLPCIDSMAINEHVDIITTATHNDNNTALIAGLTTAIVVLFLILLTFAIFVYYKRRQEIDSEKQPQEMPVDNTCKLPPISETSINPWQTFIIGAQSLQIPHLDPPPDPILARRSLNIIQPPPPTFNYVNRSSSVKVSKYDHRPIPRCDDDELKRNKPKRAVSIKKSDSTASSVTRVGSIQMVKPKMVRINTVTSKEGGIKRTVINDEPHVLETPQNSTCTLADGEITVYLDSP